MTHPKTGIISEAMRILANDIQSGDGIANAAIRQAADRLDELQARLDATASDTARIDWLARESITVMGRRDHAQKETQTVHWDTNRYEPDPDDLREAIDRAMREDGSE